MKIKMNYRTKQNAVKACMLLCIFSLVLARASAMPHIAYTASSIISSNGGSVLGHTFLTRLIPLLTIGLFSYLGAKNPPNIKPL